LLAALLAVTTLAPAIADVRIKSSPGGQIGEFIDLFTAVRETGERVVIDGPCLSAFMRHGCRPNGDGWSRNPSPPG
jgi:hypothetical protein